MATAVLSVTAKAKARKKAAGSESMDVVSFNSALSNPYTIGTEESVHISQAGVLFSGVKLHARTVPGVRKGVLFKKLASCEEFLCNSAGYGIFFSTL